MPGTAMTTFLPCASAGAAAVSAAAKSAAPAVKANVLRSIVILPEFKLLWLSGLQFEFGGAGFAHQCRPDPLAQFGEARFAQGVARARMRQIDGDDFVDAGGPTLEHDAAMAEQHRFLDRMRDEDHRSRPLFPDAQQLELEDLACLRVA